MIIVDVYSKCAEHDNTVVLWAIIIHSVALIITFIFFTFFLKYFKLKVATLFLLYYISIPRRVRDGIKIMHNN